MRLTEGTDLVFCTLDEAEVLVGTRDPELAVARLTADYREVVLKLGPAGARWASEGSDRWPCRPARRPGPSSTRTGAGDAFCAAYLAATLAGGEPADALAAGCRAGASRGHRCGSRPRPARPVSPGSPR